MHSSLPILVLTASGKTGRRVAERLVARGRSVRRASRSGATPAETFDWHDRATWGPALEGVEAAYVVYTPDLAVPGAREAIAAFCDLARLKGVRRLVLLSGRGEPEAQFCERLVADSGLEWTVVRASWFAQNFDEGVFRDLVLAGEVALPAGDVREPFVDVDDIADVAVRALTEDGLLGQVVEVTGPRALTFAEAVRELSEELGREVRFVRIPRAAFRDGLEQAGLPQVEVDLIDTLFTEVLDGRNEAVTDGVERALGRPARDFREWARAAAARGAWEPAAQEA